MGIMQPVRRDNSDFDAGLKKQIPTGSGYIRYYVSGILQFQFLKAMCPRDQLDCDLQQNENVYSRLYPMMSRGATEVNSKLYFYNKSFKTTTNYLQWYYSPVLTLNFKRAR